MVVGMMSPSPASQTSFNPALDPRIATQLRDLAAPMLEPRSPKDPVAIAEIFRIAMAHEVSADVLRHVTGFSAKMLLHFAQARTSSGRPWKGLREALTRAGVPVKPRGGYEEREVTMAAAPAKKATKKAAKKAGKKAAKVAAHKAPPVRATPAAPPSVTAPTHQAPIAPVIAAAGGVEIHDDGSITLVLRPGDPGYAETLRGLLVTRVA